MMMMMMIHFNNNIIIKIKFKQQQKEGQRKFISIFLPSNLLIFPQVIHLKIKKEKKKKTSKN
jgi:hypothetical protein